MMIVSPWLSKYERRQVSAPAATASILAVLASLSFTRRLAPAVTRRLQMSDLV